MYPTHFLCISSLIIHLNCSETLRGAKRQNQMLARDAQALNARKGVNRTRPTDGVHVCACTCVSTGSHRVQQEEGRVALVTERSDVPGMRRLGNCVGNPQCLLVNLDWKPLRLRAEIQFAQNPPV